METRLKQRLVGATVLVILVVIVVPELLDEEATSPAVLVSPAEPLAEDPDFSSRIEPMEPDGVAMPPDSDDAADRQPPEEDRETSVPPAPESESPPVTPVPRTKPPIAAGGEAVGVQAWAVQLASFADAERAVRLRDTLTSRGYEAFVQTSANDSGTFTRVLVGPALERETADALLETLEEETRLEGKVIRYP